MMFLRIEPLRDSLLNSPWLVAGLRMALAALDTVERMVTNLRTALEPVCPPGKGIDPSDGMSGVKDRRWLH